jgi:hypothetical protein
MIDDKLVRLDTRERERGIKGKGKERGRKKV